MTNDERDTMIIEIHSKVGTLADNMGDVRKTLYGNGRPGVCERLQSIDEQQRACPARQASLLGNLNAKKANNNAKKANVIQACVFVVAVISIVISALVAIYK